MEGRDKMDGDMNGFICRSNGHCSSYETPCSRITVVDHKCKIICHFLYCVCIFPVMGRHAL